MSEQVGQQVEGSDRLLDEVKGHMLVKNNRAKAFVPDEVPPHAAASLAAREARHWTKGHLRRPRVHSAPLRDRGGCDGRRVDRHASVVNPANSWLGHGR